MSKFQYKKQALKDNIAAGGGFSTDTQQTASELCYNATISSLSEPSSAIDLSSSQSFDDIQNTIKESITMKGGFGMFSASASASYLKSIEDKYYSLSLNYHAIYSSVANVQLGGFGQDALSEFGKEIYNNGTNPYFGLVCGDKFTQSYQQGAMLLLSTNIEFKSNEQKEEFDAHAGASFGDIFSASGDIQRIANQYSLDGSVSMQAYQTGGDPSQLSKILNKNNNGDYYVLTCSLQDMGNCVTAASGMLDYAVNNFPNQISFPNNFGLTPLGIGWTSYKPIYYIGLVPPKSFVTPQVESDRDQLADSFDEAEYYFQRFENLISGYPVAWDATSDLYKSIEKLYGRARDNLDLLYNVENPDQGALGCYDTPDQCTTIADNIMANLVPITADDLSFFGDAQYVLPSEFGTYFYFGSGWNILPNPPESNGLCFHDLVSVTITNSSFTEFVHYSWNFVCQGGSGVNSQCNAGTSSDGMFYKGTTSINDGPQCGNDYVPRDWTKIVSPFYFQAYNSSDTSSLNEYLAGSDE